jgi:hypothetical protein
MQIIRIQNRDMFAAMAVLLVLDCSILGAWQGTSPLRWTREIIEVDSFDRTVESLGKCTDVSSGGVDSTLFLSMLAVSN